MLWGHAVSCKDGSALDGIHVVWSSPFRGGYSIKGYDIWRRRTQYNPEIICYQLTPEELDLLHTLLRLELKAAVVSLRVGVKPQTSLTPPNEPFISDVPERGLLQTRTPAGLGLGTEQSPEGQQGDEQIQVASSIEATHLGSLLRQPTKLAGIRHILDAVELVSTCLVYQIDFHQPREMVSVAIGVPGGLAIALRESKAIDAKALTPVGNVAEAFFGTRKIDRVLLYVFEKAASLRYCYGEIDPDQEEAGWREAELIATGIQMPFRALNPALGSDHDELALATSRLLGNESIKEQGFWELSDLMNQTAHMARHTSPVYFSLCVRNQPDQRFIELMPWQYGMGVTINAAGRRMLGFSFLDAGENLVADEVYDYRIIGYFRRQDVAETFLGFHTSPLGALLPLVFYLDSIRFETHFLTQVEAYPPAPPNALGHLFRKGIPIKQRLTLTFPEPLTRIILDLEPIETHRLEYHAQLQIPTPLFVAVGYFGNIPANRRVELNFATPIDQLELEGTGFLYGVRISQLSPGEDPEELVEQSVAIYGVRYEATSPPEPPAFLGTSNLQKPLKIGKAQDTVKEPFKNMGFHLSWLPPGSMNIWPPDLDAAPPFEVVSFEIERRRVDTGEGFAPLDEDEVFQAPTTVVGSRSGRSEPQPITFGADLLKLFPERKMPKAPVPLWMELDDVLLSPGKPGGPPPGSLHQYRIYAVDIIGRRSSHPTRGSVVRLEKHLAPPQPPGPVRKADPNRIQPRGVFARVLQASDPDLTEADKGILDGASDAVILAWGWTEQERKNDPFSKEFRIYVQPNPPDLVTGSLSGMAVRNGGIYEMTATVNQDLTADQFVGQYLNAGGYPFRISTHSGGAANVKICFEPSLLNPGTVPAPGSIVVTPTLNGSELRPQSWQERRGYTPITAQVNYTYTFKNVFTGALAVTPARPKVRVWVGVSAADDQPYIPDEIPASRSQPYGGRPGNESSIAAVPVVARYFGRPDFEGPRPLWEVPTVLLDEVEGETVAHAMNLPSLLPNVNGPPGHYFLVERLSGADIAAMMSKTDDAKICLTLPDGKQYQFRYGDQLGEPGSAGDQAELLTAIGSGEAARIANKFLMDIVWRLRNDNLSAVWQVVEGTPAPFGMVMDVVPNKAERYIYRLRLVDQAGHVSLGAVFIPKVFRVPSRRVPGQPEIEKPSRNEDQVTVKLQVEEAFDLAGILLFYHAEPALGSVSPAFEKRAYLLRVPNRPDLYPQNGIRLRLADGGWAGHLFIDKSTGVLKPKYLFSMGLGFVGELNAGQVSAKLYDQFAMYNRILAPGAEVEIEQVGNKWKIVDGGRKYLLWNENQVLNVYDPEDQRLAFEQAIQLGFDQQVLIWAAAVTRDGVPSLLAGPRMIATVPAPPLVPVLSVITTPDQDRLSWSVPAAGTTLTVEMSTDNGLTWRRISPWLPSGITQHTVVAPPAGARAYRLRVRKPGRDSDAFSLTVSP